MKLARLQELRALRAESERKDAVHRTRYATEPELWVTERLGEHIWSKQAEIMQAVVAHRRTAVRSCHGIGKSHIASRIAAWWLDAHPPGDAFVVTTAPTFAQVRAILWRYIRQAHKAGKLPGRVNQTEWHIDGDIVAFGRKPADHDQAAFQGIHARYVLVIIDEACGVPEQLWIAADALTTNVECRILAIGNPDNPASHFRTVSESDLWHSIHVGAHDSPKFTGEPWAADQEMPPFIDLAWADEKLAEWGDDNPLYLSKVLGQFPSDDPNSVIKASSLAACSLGRDEPWDDEQLAPVCLGVDVGGGGDETVIRERRGITVGRRWANRLDDPGLVADSIVSAIVEVGDVRRVNIDAGGIGWGVVTLVRERLAKAGHAVEVNPVNFGSAASKPERWVSLRAEMYWQIRVLTDQRRINFAGAADADKVKAQLAAHHWDLDPKSKIRVEPKDAVKERLGRSPDDSDALVLAYHEGVGHTVEAWGEFYAKTYSKPPQPKQSKQHTGEPPTVRSAP